MIRKLLRLMNIRLMRITKPIYFALFPHRVECNICGWHDVRFLSDRWHAHVICPRCGSKIRQRLFWAAVNHRKDLNITEILNNKKVLHFAPDRCLTRKLAQEARQYKTADLLAEGYRYRSIDLTLDMSDMQGIDDEAFDCVLAFDVLEHIPDYRKALAETHRVLAPNGYCIFTVPQKDHLQTTYEDSSITEPKEREETFGQWDHLRIYGDDLAEIIAESGFEVTPVSEKHFNDELVLRNVLYPPVLSDHPLATNHRRVYFGRKVTSVTNHYHTE